MSPLPVLLGILSGCVRPDVIAPGQTEPGYVAMLPGVEGSAWQFAGTVKGLREAGIMREVDIIEWHAGPLCSMRNLTDIQANRKRAKAIAARLGAYHREHPNSPITLIGYSGGGGLAAMIAESLDEGVMLDRIILIAAALSPDYDLEPVTARCRRGVVSFFSVGDWLILGLGTRMFGTIDRVNTDSAGHVGFINDQGELVNEDKLTQIAWMPKWSDLGHDGGHVGWLSRDWAREVLAAHIASADEKVASADPNPE